MEDLSFPLDNGWVGNWLVAGPLATPVEPGFTPIVEQGAGISGTPVERGPLESGVFRAGAQTGAWAYHACPADHFVDHSGTYPRTNLLRSWAYAEVVSDASRPVDLVLTTDGAASVWLAGGATARTQDDGRPVVFRVQLERGATPVLVRFERLSVGRTAHAMAMRICRVNDEVRLPAEGVHIRIPTLIADVGRRTAFERLTSGVYVERDVYAGDTPIVLRWPAGDRAFCPAHVRLHSADDSIYALADSAGESGAAVNLGYALQLPAGPFRVTLMPTPDEVYLENMRIAVHVPFWSLGRQRYSGLAQGDPLERRTEALLAVAEHHTSPFGQTARIALGAWDDVDFGVLLEAAELVRSRGDGSHMLLLVLLGMLYRWGDHGRFPEEIRKALDDVVLGYGYAQDIDDLSESSRILLHSLELLAGQKYAASTFADGRTGAWHRARAERLAVAWMSDFGSHGSAEWGAPDAMAHELAALAHLTDLADDPRVYDLAAVCTDKLLFTLALHSRQGVVGAAAQSGRASFLKSGYLQPTAGIARLLWGVGIYNQHVAGVLSLACASGYEPPPILEAIAHDAPDELWSREQHAAPGAAPGGIDTYKTAEYILSSARGRTPETPGGSELVWRATLGPEAMVFANHPGSSSESDSRAPGYWAGNARAPHVAQWKDVLLAMHRLATDDVFDFTHAYFPCATFDEYVLRDGWAFARGGPGYLALTNSHGLLLTVEGRYALRELKAWGRNQTWLVQMGRAALDGDFAAFQAKVLAMPVTFTPETVSCRTLRGDTLTLSWSGALSVNGARQPATASKHFDNAYTTTDLPCTQMEIRFGQDYLRLDFGAVPW